MKNSIIRKITLIVIGTLLILGTSSIATIDDNVSEVYKQWQNLSKEEKKNTVEPLPVSLKISDSVKASEFNKFTRGLGSAIEPSYNMYDDVKFKIKNQKKTNECWAFATTSILETNVAKTKNKSIELSPRHIDYATSRIFLDGINEKGFNKEIGMANYFISLAYCTNGSGPVLEEDMPFEDNSNKINLSQIDKEPVLKVQDYTQFADILKVYSTDGSVQYTDGNKTQYTESQVLGVRNLIKEHVKKYGGVATHTYLPQDTESLLKYFNIQKVANGEIDTIAYVNKDNSNLCNHAFTIVGWDDNYSKDNFNDDNKPQNDGAYIVLNSSQLDNGVLSMIYVSYEDIWIEYGCVGIVSTSNIDYDTLYQYDEYGYSLELPITNSQTGENAKIAYAANVFERKKTTKEEYLNEVSVYVPKTTNVDIYVNSQNDDKTKIDKVASAGILEPGYHTVKLSTPIQLTGDKFVIATKFTSDAVVFGTETNYLSNGASSNYWDYATSMNGQSFIALNEVNWTDLNSIYKDSNICIKAFTTYQEKKVINVNSISLNKTTAQMKIKESLTLVATINPDNAANKNVIWTSSDTSVATVSKTGIITAIKEGNTIITATTQDGNKTATCNITVAGNTSKDDDVYYKDEEKNDTDINVDTNNKDNIKKEDSDNKDKTVASGIIPQTGVNITITISIILLVGTSIIIFVRIKCMRDIK